MMKQLCSIEGCGRPYHCRGWCELHYKRWHKRGDPLWTPASATDRFWAKVDKNGPIHPMLGTPCWLWPTANAKGYGDIRDGRKVKAHRFSYELAVSGTMFAPWVPLANGVEVDHRCHVKLCVNPQHLRATTRKQNMENLRGAYRTSKSGVRGVYWSKRMSCWQAAVRHRGKGIHVGYFDDLAEAEAAVVAARNELFTHNDADRPVLRGRPVETRGRASSAPVLGALCVVQPRKSGSKALPRPAQSLAESSDLRPAAPKPPPSPRVPIRR